MRETTRHGTPGPALRRMTACVGGVMVAIAATSCGGGGSGPSGLVDSSPQQQSSPVSTLTASQPTAQATAPRATAVPTRAPTQVPVQEVAALPQPVSYVPQEGKPEARFGPRPVALETAITDRIKGAGFDLSGMGVYVFTIIGTPGERLLVLDIDNAKATGLIAAASVKGGNERLLQAIVAGPDLASSRVNQVVMNYRGENMAEVIPGETGPYILVMTFPRTILEKLSRGESLNGLEFAEQVQIIVKRGRHQ